MIEKRLKSHKTRRVVFTNGVFDLFHHGHAEFLRKASAHGNYLLVGVTSDESNLKKRPSRDSWETRSSNVLKSPYVDAVIETPWSKFLTPDFYQEYGISVHVQGDEDSDFGPARDLGILKILGRTEEISTSMILGILESASSTELAGGDVNDVYSVCHNGNKYIVKQAKRQTAKSFEFNVPQLRVRDEFDSLIAFRATLGQSDFITKPVWTDSKNTLILHAVPFENETLATALSRQHVSEKRLLEIMTALGLMHQKTKGNSGLQSRFGHTRGFREIKIGIQCLKASRDPEVLGVIQNLMSMSDEAEHALLHGDFAPKNILVSEASFTFIDFEESGYWDPALDVGYFFAHLVISSVVTEKMVTSRSSRMVLTKLFKSYAESYGQVDAQFTLRVVKYIGVFILSRLDSPAPDKNIPLHERPKLRSLGERLLLEPISLEGLGQMFVGHVADGSVPATDFDG